MPTKRNVPIGTVYLLCFSEKLKHAYHYIGFTVQQVAERLAEHRKGIGARITQVAVRAGIDLYLARVWENVTRGFERRLKNMGGASRICPICRMRKEVAL